MEPPRHPWILYISTTSLFFRPQVTLHGAAMKMFSLPFTVSDYWNCQDLHGLVHISSKNPDHLSQKVLFVSAVIKLYLLNIRLVCACVCVCACVRVYVCVCVVFSIMHPKFLETCSSQFCIPFGFWVKPNKN